MAYGLKYFCTHKESTGSVVTDYKIELLKDGYLGATTEVKGAEGIGGLSYPRLMVTELFENPLQGGVARFELYISEAMSYDGEAILDEIYAGDETTFLMRISAKVGGGSYQTVFTGFVMNDLHETVDGEYGYTSKIYAKDLIRAAGERWPITDDRVSIIKTIAGFLDVLGLDLDIYTYTTFVTSETTDAQDYLAQIYNDRIAYQVYAKTGDESPETISVETALKWVLRTHKLFLRQVDGAWRLFHLSAFENPASVWETRYDSNGDTLGASSVDLTTTVNQSARYILPSGTNAKTKAYKSVTENFNHRTAVSGIEFPAKVELEPPNFSYVASQFFLSDGSQDINFYTEVEAFFGQEPDDAIARVAIKAGDDYWNGTSWQGTFVFVEVPMNLFNVTAAEVPADQFTATAARALVTIQTTNVPSGADSIEITLQNSYDNSGAADKTVFINREFFIANAIATPSSTYIKYHLTQTAKWSNTAELEDTYFGDGPVGYSRAALRFSTDDADLTGTIWQRRGDAGDGYRGFHENGLKEFMDVQRGIRSTYEGSLWGTFSALSVIQKGSQNLFFFGGDLTINGNIWDAYFLCIDIEKAGDDTFDDIPKYSEPGTIGGQPSGGGTSGGGLSKAIADGLYFAQDNNLSEGDAATMLTNLGLSPTDNVSFNDLELTGTINYVNETDLQVEDKSITLNKNGTDATSENAGIIIERPAGNQSMLWDSVDGFVFSDDIKVTGNLKIDGWLTANSIRVGDARSTSDFPNSNESVSYMPNPGDDLLDKGVVPIFSQDWPGDDWGGIVTVKAWRFSHAAWQIAGNAGYNSTEDQWYLRTGLNSTWNSWNEIWTSASLTNVSQLSNDAGYYSSGDNASFGTLDASESITTKGTLVSDGSNFTKILLRRGTGSSLIGMSPDTNNIVIRAGQSAVNQIVINADTSDIQFESNNVQSLVLDDTNVSAKINIEALGSEGIETRRGMHGGYNASSPGSNNWGTNIWSIGDGWNGSGHGQTFALDNGQYGLVWLRNGHPSVRTEGEGLYIYRDSDSEDYVFGQNGAYISNRLAINAPYDGLKRLRIGGDAQIDGDLDINSNILLEAATGISHANDHQDPSDRRIKEIIDSDVDPLNFARNARLHYYDKRGLKQFGLFAQDLMKADGRIVGTIDDDEFGEIYTLSGYSVASIALAGVGRVDTKIERLEEEVKQLREQVTQLGGVA